MAAVEGDVVHAFTGVVGEGQHIGLVGVKFFGIIWVGGGVTFGPRKEKDYSKKINKKMRVQALYSVLSRKLKDGEILFVDDISFAEPKTKDAKTVIEALSGVKGFEALKSKRRK